MSHILSFKPCYKWITFNTIRGVNSCIIFSFKSFKPCYKWITFNTDVIKNEIAKTKDKVLNLVINGLPSILLINSASVIPNLVLNLVINGLPSIRYF